MRPRLQNRIDVFWPVRESQPQSHADRWDGAVDVETVAKPSFSESYLHTRENLSAFGQDCVQLEYVLL